MILAWPCIINSCPAVWVQQECVRSICSLLGPGGQPFSLSHQTPSPPTSPPPHRPGPSPIRRHNDAELFSHVWIIQGENAHWLGEKMCQSAVLSNSLNLLNEGENLALKTEVIHIKRAHICCVLLLALFYKMNIFSKKVLLILVCVQV